MKRRRILPSYRHHKPSGRAVVTLNGQDHYLGPWKSQISRDEYDRLVGEWLANGRRLSSPEDPVDLTVVELIGDYWEFAQQYYRKNGQPTRQLPGVKVTLRLSSSAELSAARCGVWCGERFCVGQRAKSAGEVTRKARMGGWVQLQVLLWPPTSTLFGMRLIHAALMIDNNRRRRGGRGADVGEEGSSGSRQPLCKYGRIQTQRVTRCLAWRGWFSI